MPFGHLVPAVVVQDHSNLQSKVKIICNLDDGNLVIYNGQDLALWNSNTQNKGTAPYTFHLQTDSNLVLYDSKGQALWNSNTAGGIQGSMSG
jgi:hypothetical protein